MPDKTPTTINAVKNFWELNPLCAQLIPYPLGTPDYFQYYDKLREANESPAFSHWLHKYSDFTSRRVLDVGCGNGYVLSKYATAGAQVYGLDITSAAVRLSRQRFAYLDLPGTFLVANAEQLPFAPASFDCVCSMGVLHHTPDTTQALREIYRVLKPGGWFISMFYHRHSILYQFGYPLLSLITGKSRAQLVNEFDGLGNPKGEVFSARELRGLLHGFTDFDFFAGYLCGWMILPKIGRLIPAALLKPWEKRWGWFLYVRCRKPASSE